MSFAYDRVVEQTLAGTVVVRVPAKINVHLGCGPLRPDGYHDLVTVYQAISLYDELRATASDTLVLTIDGEGADTLPRGGSNLVVRAVEALAIHTGHQPTVRLHLTKHIPVAGGLAGGSADAAAALVACDALWGTRLSSEALVTIAANLGSDVPFLLPGGTALGTGRGEQLSVLPDAGDWHWVIAIANGGLSTPAVYRELDRLRDLGLAPQPAGTPDQLLAALGGADPRALADLLSNDLQPAAISLRPDLVGTLQAGRTEGALAGLLSGSGPTCLFLARDATHATALAGALTQRGVCRAVRVAHGPVSGARVVSS